MTVLTDKWNENLRMYRVMAKTLQQARYEKIWEAHGSEFVTLLKGPHSFERLLDMVAPPGLAASLDVSALTVATSTPSSLGREVYFSCWS